MTPARAAAYIGGGMLLAAWLSSAATEQDPQPDPATPPQATSGSDPVAFDVQAQAARLRARLASAPVPQQPARNPFAFAVPEVPRLREPSYGRMVQAAAAAPTVGALEPEPQLTLVGMAEKQTPTGSVRTAVIVDGADEVLLVTEGQEVAGRYRVTVIAADAVELQEVSTGAVRRLVLR